MSLSSMRNLVSGSDAFSYVNHACYNIIEKQNYRVQERCIFDQNNLYFISEIILNARAFCLYRKEAEPGPNVSSVALAEKGNRALIVC